MKIEPVFEGELEIGRFYLVPMVYGPFYHRYDYYPVLGPMHDDKEIIGFPYVHYHYDFRFFNKEQWEFALRWTYGVPHKMVMSYNPNYPDTKLGEIIFRRRKCQRTYPEFPYEDTFGWLFDLKQKYKNVVMKDLVCPHKGASLRGLPEDGDGCITCPLHGLKWNLETGRLVRSE